MFTIVLLSLLVLASTELVQVIELIRHGARGPVVKGYYDTNKWNTELFGQLNAAGLRQHYNLGRKLREEYGNFLSLTFNQNEVLIYSTDFNRTLLSVSAHLQGLFPLGEGQMTVISILIHQRDNPPPSKTTTNILYSNNRLLQSITLTSDQIKNSPQFIDNECVPPFAGARNYLNDSVFALPNGLQLMPIHVMPATDMVISNYCPAWPQLQKIQLERHEDAFSRMETLVQPFAEELSNIFAQKLQTIDDLSNLYDVLAADRWAARPLPELFTEQHWRLLSLIQSWVWAFFTAQGEYNRITSTPFFNKILKTFEDKSSLFSINTSNNLKWLLLSAHDTNIVRALGALNLTTYACVERMYRVAIGLKENQTQQTQCELTPEFASSMIFELHKIVTLQGDSGDDSTTFQVKVRYNGNYMQLCESTRTECPLQEFAERLRAQFVPNPLQSCQDQLQFANNNSSDQDTDLNRVGTQQTKSNKIIAIILGIFCVIQLGAIVYIVTYYRNKLNNIIKQDKMSNIQAITQDNDAMAGVKPVKMVELQ